MGVGAGKQGGVGRRLPGSAGPAAEGPPLGSEMALGQKQGLAWDRPSGHPIPRCHRRAGLSQLCLWVSDKAESSVPARGSLRAAHMPHSSLQIPG